MVIAVFTGIALHIPSEHNIADEAELHTVVGGGFFAVYAMTGRRKTNKQHGGQKHQADKQRNYIAALLFCAAAYSDTHTLA